jgi:hypothetical protein
MRHGGRNMSQWDRTSHLLIGVISEQAHGLFYPAERPRGLSD